MDKKKYIPFFQKKGLLLTLMLAFFACLVIFPAAADAQGTITVGRDRRLNQTITLPINVSGFPNNMAVLRLNIKVISTDPAKLVGITDLSRGSDFPAGATWNKHLPASNEASVGVINCANLTDGQLFNITVKHTAVQSDNVTLSVQVTVDEAVTAAGEDIKASIVRKDGYYNTDIGLYYGRIKVGRMYGDINGDDNVDISDVMYVLRAAVGNFTIIDPVALAAGNVSGSAGSVLTAYDAFLIAQFVAGAGNITTPFPAVDPSPDAGLTPVPSTGVKPSPPTLIEVEGVDITAAGITDVPIADSSDVDVKITFSTFTGWVKLVIEDHNGDSVSFGDLVTTKTDYTFTLDLQGLDLSTDVTVTTSLIADEESDKLIAHFKEQ